MKKTYFNNLDSLRTIAFLMVFFFHSFHTNYDSILENKVYNFVNNFFQNGDLGVNFFFVLSGFLITYLLIEEENNRGKIRVFNFYMRRILRIWPLYFAVVFFGFVVFPLLKIYLGNELPNETANPWLFVFFLSNYNNIINGMPDASVLGVLWSISIEEQFYLFWPLILIFMKRYRYALFVMLPIINIIYRGYNYHNEVVIYFDSISVISNLSVGGFFGFIIQKDSRLMFFLKEMKLYQIYIIYTLMFLITIFRQSIFSGQFMISIENFIYSLFFIWVILEQIFCSNSIIKLGNIRYLNFWGKYTYGLYCLHFIGILISTNASKILGINDTLFSVLFLETFIALLISHLFAWLSYEIFEKHFLLLKNRDYK